MATRDEQPADGQQFPGGQKHPQTHLEIPRCGTKGDALTVQRKGSEGTAFLSDALQKSNRGGRRVVLKSAMGNGGGGEIPSYS